MSSARVSFCLHQNLPSTWPLSTKTDVLWSFKVIWIPMLTMKVNTDSWLFRKRDCHTCTQLRNKNFCLSLLSAPLTFTNALYLSKVEPSFSLLPCAWPGTTFLKQISRAHPPISISGNTGCAGHSSGVSRKRGCTASPSHTHTLWTQLEVGCIPQPITCQDHLSPVCCRRKLCRGPKGPEQIGIPKDGVFKMPVNPLWFISCTAVDPPPQLSTPLHILLQVSCWHPKIMKNITQYS